MEVDSVDRKFINSGFIPISKIDQLIQNGMKQIITFFMLISIVSGCKAQTSTPDFNSESFEQQVLAYQPKQGHLSEKDYKYGLMILNEVKKDVNNNPANFTCPDYFNILSSFLSLRENIETVEMAYEKFKNSEGSCEYFLSKGLFKAAKYNIIRSDVEKQITICSGAKVNNSTPLNLKEYASKNNLNYNLVQLIESINKRDNKYRADETTDFSKQTPLDIENQRLIDSLYTAHHKYLGTSLTGEKYNYVMWSVIQHSNPEMMGKYLPVVQEAVETGELGEKPFKMLIDRYYGLTYGYQIFGSQSGFGFKMANDTQRKEVEEKYGVE